MPAVTRRQHFSTSFGLFSNSQGKGCFQSCRAVGLPNTVEPSRQEKRLQLLFLQMKCIQMCSCERLNDVQARSWRGYFLPCSCQPKTLCSPNPNQVRKFQHKNNAKSYKQEREKCQNMQYEVHQTSVRKLYMLTKVSSVLAATDTGCPAELLGTSRNHAQWPSGTHAYSLSVVDRGKCAVDNVSPDTDKNKRII